MHRKVRILILILSLLMVGAFYFAGNYFLSASSDQQFSTKTLLASGQLIKKNTVSAHENQLAIATTRLQSIDREFTIGRGKLTFYAGESYNNKFRNLEIVSKYLNGYEIKPGENFSYNKVIHLLDPNVDNIYFPGFGTDGVITGGGVCSGSVLMATAAKNAGLPFQLPTVKHKIYLPEYYRVADIDGQKVLPVDAAVSTYFGYGGNMYSAADVMFKNTTPYTLVLHFESDWKPENLDGNYPYARNQNTINLVTKINIKEIL